MLIPTKFNIGHTYWVPRCVIEYSTEEMRFEGETWNREVRNYVGYAKQKRIIKIVASTKRDGGIKIQYYCLNTDDKYDNGFSQVYDQEDINDYTEDEALAVAKEYEAMEQEYFGN